MLLKFYIKLVFLFPGKQKYFIRIFFAFELYRKYMKAYFSVNPSTGGCTSPDFLKKKKWKLRNWFSCISQPIPIFFTLEKSLATPEIRSRISGLLTQCFTYKLQVFIKKRVIKLEFWCRNKILYFPIRYLNIKFY